MKKTISLIIGFITCFSIITEAQLPYPNEGEVNVNVNTDYILPSNLDPGFLTDSTTYKLVVLSADGLTVIDSTDFMYDNVSGNTVSISTVLDYNTTYQWNVWEKGTPPTVGLQTYTIFPFSFTTTRFLTITKSNPANNSDVTGYDPLQFTWYLNSTIGDIKFLLQILEDPGHTPTESDWESNTIIEYSNISQTYKSVSGLHGSTRYYWRVTAYYNSGSISSSFDDDDAVIKISDISMFTTKGGAVKAYLSYPVNNELVYSLRPTFYWYTNEQEANATYELLVATDPAVNGELASGLVVSTPLNAGNLKYLKLTSDLEASTKYYWQVRTQYLTQTNLSAVDSFLTDDIGVVQALKPEPSYPTNNVVIYTTSPTLWYYVNGVSDELDFAIQVEDISSGAVSGSPFTSDVLNKTISGLTPGKTYKWRVKSYEEGNVTNESQFSDWEIFTIAGGGLSQAVAGYPVGNPTVFTLTPTVLWYVQGSSLGFDNFTVKIYHDDSNSGAPTDWEAQPVAATITNANTFSYTFNMLQAGEKYYWAVAFDDGISPAPMHADYAQGSFTVAGGSQTEVVLTAPKNLTIVYSTTVALHWTFNGTALGIDKYRVTYSNTKSFVNDTLYTKTIETTTNTASINNLLHGATYYWFVEISYDNGITWINKSNSFEFTVHPGSFSVVPKIGSPDNGIRIIDGAPMLSWLLPVNSDSKLTFDVQVADNPDFVDAKEYADLNSFNEQLNKLSEGQYYWRVRSKVAGNKSGNVSLFSEPGSFRIDNAVTGIVTSNRIPEGFKLEQNYPNPFNPITTIKYTIPSFVNSQLSLVQLKIYDAVGEKVATLVNEPQSPGSYEVLFDASQLSSGIYFYKLETEKFNSTGKMVLIK